MSGPGLEELEPFAESLGVRPAGDRLNLSLSQLRLLGELYGDRPPEQVDRWELELQARSTRRRWANVRAIACAMLQGTDVALAHHLSNGELRRLLQDVREELELIGRTLNLDVRPALERLATVALSATKR